MNTYARLPVAFTSGQGAYLQAEDGKQYLDGLTGLAVVGVGHANQRVAEAIARQAQTLTHTSNLYEFQWTGETLASPVFGCAAIGNTETWVLRNDDPAPGQMLLYWVTAR